MTQTDQVQQRLQRDYRLRVLRIYMDTSASETALAVFAISFGDETPAALLTASLQELGFAAHGAGGISLPERYAVPVHVVAALRALLDDDKHRDKDRGKHASANEVLWLRLSEPLGLLAALPWEELLQPRLDVPVLRLPYHALTPRIPGAGIDTVVCFSSPYREPHLSERIEAFVREVPLELAQATCLHMFGNRSIHPHLCDLQREYAGRVRIKVYDPAHAASLGDAPINPWLAWMKAELGQRSIDVVHFLCHGMQELDEGMLLLAADPADGEPGLPACVLDRANLVAFLDYLGAWCVAFTSAPAEPSAAGMHMLQTAVAQHRPGPVLVHDMNVAGSRDALQAAYTFLFGHPEALPATPAVALNCHPALLWAHVDDQVSREQLARFTLDRKLGGRVSDPDLPWLASSQRKLEGTAGELAEAVEQGAVGRARARELVLDAVARQTMRQSAVPRQARRGRHK